MRSRYYGPRDRHCKHEIPIYDMEFEVALCHDVKKFRNSKRLVKWSGGTFKDDDDYVGLFVSTGRRTALLIQRSNLTHKLIAHELMHAAHYMMEHNNVKFGPKWCHETSALIMEHLSGIVYGDLKKWKCSIR